MQTYSQEAHLYVQQCSRGLRTGYGVARNWWPSHFVVATHHSRFQTEVLCSSLAWTLLHVSLDNVDPREGKEEGRLIL